MNLDWSGLLGLAGPLAIFVLLLVLGTISRRMGSVTRTPPYYLWFYAGALMMGVSLVARMINIGRGSDIATTLHEDPLMVILYVALPAIALTIAAVVSWRYWSWLLAERG